MVGAPGVGSTLRRLGPDNPSYGSQAGAGDVLHKCRAGSNGHSDRNPGGTDVQDVLTRRKNEAELLVDSHLRPRLHHARKHVSKPESTDQVLSGVRWGPVGRR